MSHDDIQVYFRSVLVEVTLTGGATVTGYVLPDPEDCTNNYVRLGQTDNKRLLVAIPAIAAIREL